jgi:hypothetical protein
VDSSATLIVLIAAGSIVLTIIVLLRILGKLTQFFSDISELIFTTGNSDTSFFIKVVISILCPPLLIVFLYRVFFLRGDEDQGEIDKQIASKLEQEERDRSENAKLWRDGS